MNNTYYLMRHGEYNKTSFLDTRKSLKENPLKKESEKEILIRFEKTELKKDEIIIFCSDYLRTIQTAEIISNKYIKRKELRERETYMLDSNELEEGFEISNYNNLILAEETKDHFIERINSFIKEIENKFSNENIFLITHQDTAEVIQAIFKKSPLLLRTSEIIKLN